MIKCKLIINSYSPFLQQIYAGFCLLESTGKISLEIVKSKYFSTENELKPFVEIVLDGSINIVIDTFDQGHLFEEKKLTIKPDYYFKRSYSDEMKIGHRFSEILHPLGLNYFVTDYTDRVMPVSRFIKGKVKRILSVADNLLGTNLAFNCNISEYENPPKLNSDCKILFTTRLWDPDEFKNLSPSELENRLETNEFRAMVIRTLKKNFPDHFLGGVERSAFTEKYYADCQLESNKIFERRNYFSNLRKHDICISTSGLFHANGWKFAEYCAASRAIVTEKVHYSVPGNFLENQNYLVFTDEDSLTNAVSKLIENQEQRFEMMKSNYSYYQNYVRPDKLIENILSVALSES